VKAMAILPTTKQVTIALIESDDVSGITLVAK